MDTKPHCVINPRTNRAVKATSALGKKLLKDLENGNKSVVEAQKPVAKKSVVKKEVKKTQPHTMYKKPIGPRVQEIPNMLRKLTSTGAKSNKVLETHKDWNYTRNKDGNLSMKRVFVPEKFKIEDTKDWRLEMLDFQITTHSNKTVIENFDMWLRKINAHLTLNRKLDDDDIANFNSIYKYVDKLIFQLQDRMKLDNSIKEVFETKLFSKYLKLRKKITGEVNDKLNVPDEPKVYNKPNVFPKKGIKPDYTKDGYFEDVVDLENYFKSLVNLKPELKELYNKHKLDIGVFAEKLNKIDKRIPSTVELFNKIYGSEGIDILVEIFKTKKPIRRGR